MNLSKIETIQLCLFIILMAATTAFTTKNEVKVERVICKKTKPESVFQDVHCKVKFISRYRLIYDLHWNVTKPLHDVWLHGSVNYKYNGLVYQKFPIDLWENACDWLSGKKQKSTYILDWTMGRVLNYSNTLHPCPLYGYQYVRATNISMDLFVVEPLLPSGRYRLDITFTHHIHDPVPIVEVVVFFSVSDYRLEII